MRCISSPALGDAQIVSFIEGEADAVVAGHMAECPYCAEKAERWGRLQNSLKAKLYRRSCPTSMELGDYHLGLLPGLQALLVAQHVRECPLCRHEVNELEEYLKELAAEPGLLEPIKVLIARLVGGKADELSRTPAFAALRGEIKGPIIFEVDDVVITLDIQPGHNGQGSILGQVAVTDQDGWTGARVQLQQSDRPQLTASLDDLGAFRFEEAQGLAQITITSPSGIMIEIPNFDIAF